MPGVSGGELVVHGGLEFVSEIGAVEGARISAARPHCPNPTREMNEWGLQLLSDRPGAGVCNLLLGSMLTKAREIMCEADFLRC